MGTGSGGFRKMADGGCCYMQMSFLWTCLGRSPVDASVGGLHLRKVEKSLEKVNFYEKHVFLGEAGHNGVDLVKPRRFDLFNINNEVKHNF